MAQAQDTEPAEPVGCYSFVPLPGLGALRTLELLPGRSSDPLRGCLHVHGDVPVDGYEALSYTWGSPVLSHAICIEGKRFPISANLHSALVRLRLQARSRILWADGICINQTDNGEKSKQVSCMGSYYRHAKQVIVYLGEAADGSDGVRDLLDRISASLLRMPGMFVLEHLLPQLGLPPSGHEAWTAAMKLLERPWWYRYWVIQELVLGKKVTVVCGSWECDWNLLGQAYEAINELQLPFAPSAERADAVYSGFRCLSNMVSMRSDLGKAEGELSSWPLIHLLDRFRSSSCSDDRDYIYGILDLCSERAGLRGGVDSSAVDWMPDYEEDPAETFTRFARYMVSWGDGITVLYSVTQSASKDGLPSWVPNWADGDTPWRPLAPKTGSDWNYPFKAASQREAQLRLSTATDHLIVRGTHLGRLVQVGAPATTTRQPNELDPDGVFSRDFSIVHSFASDLIRFLEQARPRAAGLGGTDLKDQAWRTVCCNVDALTLGDVDPRLRESFEAMLDLKLLWDAILNGQEVAGMERYGELVRTGRIYMMRAAPFCLRRRPALTEDGKACLVPAWAQRDDEVFLPFGSAVPFVVRPVPDGHTLQGECYVHGVMKGELFSGGSGAGLSAEELILV